MRVPLGFCLYPSRNEVIYGLGKYFKQDNGSH